ncbi:hypothetical protein TSAR_007079 [Trichomalopsis sarcophagae]|uniref:SET domain-containing protein n=1 Tax=Trichomalopsis sarcophagae TaxID=543379 RepID=A0A232ERA2_9HYME|nr:hypothetical protein TSAR_007079 [Trichomalopsis sarcophagae]
MDEGRGVKVMAMCDLKRNESLNIIGILRPISDEIEKRLKIIKANFSIMQTTMNKQPALLLGPASFLNHSCEPNYKYVSCSKTGVTISTIKDIKKGNELVVSYGEDYFDQRNKNCECISCEQNKKGAYSDFLNDEELIAVSQSSNDLDKTLNRKYDIRNFPDLSLDNKLRSAIVLIRKLDDYSSHENENDLTERNMSRGISNRSKIETDIKSVVTKPQKEKNRKNKQVTFNVKQLLSMSSNRLVNLFSVSSSDEVKRKYSYSCALVPECSQKFTSFASEAKAKVSIKLHLADHLKSIKNNEQTCE